MKCIQTNCDQIVTKKRLLDKLLYLCYNADCHRRTVRRSVGDAEKLQAACQIRCRVRSVIVTGFSFFRETDEKPEPAIQI